MLKKILLPILILFSVSVVIFAGLKTHKKDLISKNLTSQNLIHKEILSKELVSKKVINKELIPTEILFGNPKKAMLRISPDAKYLSYLAPGTTEETKDFLNIWIKSLDKDDDKQLTFANKRSITNYTWSEDSSKILYLRDKDGDENWRLYGLSLIDSKTIDYTPFNNVKVNIIGRDKNYPNTLLIALNKDNSALHDIYKLDLNTGQLTLNTKNLGSTVEWTPDSNLNIRAIANTNDDGKTLFYRETANSPWKEIQHWSYDDSETSSVLGFDKNNKSLYLLDCTGQDKACLVKKSLENNKNTTIATENADIESVLIDEDNKEPVAYSYTTDYKHWVGITEEFKELLNQLNLIDSGTLNIVDHDSEKRYWIVCFEKDTSPKVYYLYDTKTKKASKIFSILPDLEKYNHLLNQTKPISFKASDGLTINGYLTLPKIKQENKKIKNKKNFPLMLRVHGGPWARDKWEFNPEVQWLANRGYAVMQINYRGSTGYGKSFISAGAREWAGKMHQDLIDGINWCISQNIADPKKIGIYGGSYGGYAALVGASFTPDIFCCAVDLVGPSNLITLIKSIPPYWQSYKQWFYKHVGNPDTEEEFLKERSPLFKVKNIKIPLLIVQGANDPRVKQAEAEQIVQELKNHNLPHEYLLFNDEGHGLLNQKNRFKFYERLEQFLEQNLK